VVVPDVYQLEHGIHVRGVGNFVGSIHFIAGDHKELCDIGGLSSMKLHICIQYIVLR